MFPIDNIRSTYNTPMPRTRHSKKTRRYIFNTLFCLSWICGMTYWIYWILREPPHWYSAKNMPLVLADVFDFLRRPAYRSDTGLLWPILVIAMFLIGLLILWYAQFRRTKKITLFVMVLPIGGAVSFILLGLVGIVLKFDIQAAFNRSEAEGYLGSYGMLVLWQAAKVNDYIAYVFLSGWAVASVISYIYLWIDRERSRRLIRIMVIVLICALIVATGAFLFAATYTWVLWGSGEGDEIYWFARRLSAFEFGCVTALWAMGALLPTLLGIPNWLAGQSGPQCADCGYDLTGNESGVCPECGESISTKSAQT